jgi:hypothetical protein
VADVTLNNGAGGPGVLERGHHGTVAVVSSPPRRRGSGKGMDFRLPA